MFTLRPFMKTDEEFEAITGILNAIWPDERRVLEELKHRDQNWDDQYYRVQLVAEVDGKIVAAGGWGEVSWSHRPGKYYFAADVHPEYDEVGIEAAIYQRMIDDVYQRSPTPIMFTSGVREDMDKRIRFLEAHGYQFAMRWPGSRLNLAEFDSTRFEEKARQVAESGIMIRSISEQMKHDPDWQRNVYELDWECTQDEPMPDTPTKLPFERYVKLAYEAPSFLPDGLFVALDGDRYVGMTEVEKDLADPEKLETGFTAVARSHRRRGIATALKLRALAFAKEYGAKSIDTGNEENNPMFQINLRMGFKPKPAWMAYEKKLKNGQ